MRETTEKFSSSQAEHLAGVIDRCFSKATLTLAALELGTPIAHHDSIFHALIAANIATDFNHAVEIVATYLDNCNKENDVADHEGKIERRNAL